LNANRAEVDVPIAAAPLMIEPRGGFSARRAEAARTDEGALLGAFGDDALAEGAPAAEEVPEHLAEGDLLLFV
jgi:hypothetical protein